MKKILTIATSAMLLVACSEKPGYEITGTVSNSDLNGKYVYLYEYGVRDAAPLDSALVENGAFKLKGEQAVPVLRVLRFAPDVVEPQRGMPFTATFTLENARLAATLDSTSTVSGTPENDEQNALRDKVKEMSSSFDQLIADMRSGDEERIKEAEEKYEAIDHEITGMVTDYILAHADQPIAAKTLLENQYSIGEKEQDEIIAKASEAFKAVPGINRLVEHLEVLKNVAVGKKFTDFEMADAKGEMHKLSEYVGNGKVVLIDFWASWCGPCRAEMPNLVKAYKDYKAKGFEIIGISLDNKAEAWEKGIKDLGITWAQLSDLKGWQNGGAALYGVNSIPHTVLVDKDGTIIAKNLRGQELEDKLKEVLE